MLMTLRFLLTVFLFTILYQSHNALDVSDANQTFMTTLFPEVNSTSQMTSYVTSLTSYAASVPGQLLTQAHEFMTHKIFNTGQCFEHHEEPQPSLADREDDAYTFGRYAAAAYCVAPIVLKTWTCAAHCTNTVTHGTSDVVVWEDIITGIKYYVAVNHSKKSLIIAFRGTLTPGSFFVDAAVAQVKYTGHPEAPEDARIHAGFFYSFYRVSSRLRDSIKQVAALITEEYTIDVTGHSLGGAMATICALDLVGQKMFPASRVRLFTFGQPRTGNPAFAEFVSNIGFRSISRITFNNDLIPHVPPTFMGYAHHRGEVWLEGWWFRKNEEGLLDWLKGIVRDHLGFERRVTVCKDMYCEDSGCSNRKPPFLNILNHLRAWDITFGPWC